jgi:anti-sigma factor RsiW
MGQGRAAGITDEDLSAYLDGDLAPLRRAQLEAALRADPQLARRLAAYRAQEQGLRQMASSTLDEPVPERLLEAVRRPRPSARPRGWRTMPKVAMPLAASLLVGIALGWLLHAGLQPAEDGLLGPFVRQAVISHELFETGQELAELQAVEGGALLEEVQSPFRTPIRIPQLLGGAWRPVQVRAVEGVDGPGIQIAYLGESGLTSLLIRQHSAQDDLLVRFAEVDGRAVLYWLDGPLIYALVGEGGEEELQGMARSVYAATATGGRWRPPSGDLQPATEDR